MRATLFFGAISALILITFGCTGAVAPQTEGSGVSGSSENQQISNQDPEAEKSEGDATGNPDQAGNEEGGDGLETGDGSSESDYSGSNGGGESVGTIEGEETDFDNFSGVSTYMLYMESANILTLGVYNTSMTEDDLTREIDTVECVKCEGDNDPDCSSETALMLTFNFSGNNPMSIADFKVNSDGFPDVDEFNVTEMPTDPMAADYMDKMKEYNKQGLTLYQSIDSASMMGHTGTLKFTEKPANVDDPFNADVDITYGNGKKYKATLSGNVYTPADPPDYPKCDVGNGEKYKVTFK